MFAQFCRLKYIRANLPRVLGNIDFGNATQGASRPLRFNTISSSLPFLTFFFSSFSFLFTSFLPASFPHTFFSSSFSFLLASFSPTFSFPSFTPLSAYIRFISLFIYIHFFLPTFSFPCLTFIPHSLFYSPFPFSITFLPTSSFPCFTSFPHPFQFYSRLSYPSSPLLISFPHAFFSRPQFSSTFLPTFAFPCLPISSTMPAQSPFPAALNYLGTNG